MKLQSTELQTAELQSMKPQSMGVHTPELRTDGSGGTDLATAIGAVMANWKLRGQAPTVTFSLVFEAEPGNYYTGYPDYTWFINIPYITINYKYFLHNNKSIKSKILSE